MSADLSTGVESSILTPISKLLSLIETVFAVIASVCLGAIMMIVVVDVVLRYGFNSPLGWSYSLIGIYLMVAVFFLMLSDTLPMHHHVAIDMLMHRLPHRLRHLFLAIGYLLSTIIIALIVWQAWLRWMGQSAPTSALLRSYPGPPGLPMPSSTGSALLVLRTAYRTIGHVASAITGRTLVEMPPVTADETAAIESEGVDAAHPEARARTTNAKDST
tara:strand:- start:6223 stop:6873 length:651 start_codon:yes stop_codon:yes gene_type:complete